MIKEKEKQDLSIVVRDEFELINAKSILKETVVRAAIIVTGVGLTYLGFAAANYCYNLLQYYSK